MGRLALLPLAWLPAMLIALDVELARADGAATVADVIHAVDGADFEHAEILAQALLGSGNLSRAEGAQLYLELGLVACARRKQGDAEAAFGKALVLDPASSLPPSAGPDASKVFARAKAASLAPEVSVSLRWLMPSELSVEVRLAGDARRLARQVVLDAQGDRETRALAAEGGHFTVHVPDGPEGCRTVNASVGDEHGNRFWPDLTTAACPVPSAVAQPARARDAAPTPVPSALSTARPIPPHVWLTGSLALGAAATTTVLGIIALDRRADYHAKNDTSGASVSERESLRSLAESAETRASVAGITTAVAVVATVVLYLTRPTVARSASRTALLPDTELLLGRF